MKLFSILCLLVASVISSRAAIIYFSADVYRSRTDNPFLSYIAGGTVYVEDFENQGSQRPRNVLTTPNATGWNGLASGSPNWGVQEDYSSDENSLGYIWTSTGSSADTRKAPDGIHFDFVPDENGRYPEYVGAAARGLWVGATNILGTDPDFNIILVYDSNGIEVTNGEWKIPKPIIDSNTESNTLFFNFEGIYVSGGISRILFRDFFEVDHLTYGYSAIPEPAVTGLASAAALGLGLRRRRLS